MANLDEILNIVIPVGIFLILGAILYLKLKEPIDQVIEWIKGLFSYGKESFQDVGEEATSYVTYAR